MPCVRYKIMKNIILLFLILISISCWASPEKELALYNDIYYKINVGDTADAIKLCKKQIKKNKDNIAWSYLLSQAYLMQGDYNLAKETLSKLPPSKDVIRLLNNCTVADSPTQNPLPYTPRYMGDSVNTVYDNIWPSLTPKEDILFTTVVVSGNAFPQEDIYYSLPIEGNAWAPAKALPEPINTDENEGSQCFSADGKYMFLVRCNQRDGYGSCDIYYCIKKGHYWSKPINAGKVINSRAWESTPAVSADFTTLYFSSNQKPSKGGKDIFKAEIGILPSGYLEFYNVKNIGDSINSFYDETAPFIHADGRTLYFSSDAIGSMGGLDVFYSRMDSTGIWSKPQNMGYPLNSVRDDIGFCTNLSGEKGYISAPRNVGTSSNMVIYEVNMPKKVRPLPTLLVNNSEFSAIKAGGKVIMNNILFDFNESTLVESSKKELDKLANILTESPELNIIISGHTDSIGNADYNQILSMKRAISVSEYLNAKGIEKERMRCKGFGSSAPLLPNNSEENRAKNRRIEIEFY